MTIRNAALASAALVALAACRGGHQATSELLPDLDQLAPSAVSIVEKDGTERLVFLSAVENVGRGPLLVAGRRPTRDRVEMSGRQLVRRADGSTATYSLASRFRFVVSETHRHWHLLDFERYELRTPGGKAVGRDHKTGFCLGDATTPGLKREFPASRVRRSGRRNAEGGSPRGCVSAKVCRLVTATTTCRCLKVSTSR